MWILFLASVSVSRSLFTLKIFKLLSRTKFLIGYVMCLFNSFWLADDNDDDDEELKSTTKDTLTIAIVVLVAIVVYILRMYVWMYLCMYIECSVTLPVENTKENSSLASSSSSFSSTTAAVYPSGHPEAVLIPRQKQIIWKKKTYLTTSKTYGFEESFVEHMFQCCLSIDWVSSNHQSEIKV